MSDLFASLTLNERRELTSILDGAAKKSNDICHHLLDGGFGACSHYQPFSDTASELHSVYRDASMAYRQALADPEHFPYEAPAGEWLNAVDANGVRYPPVLMGRHASPEAVLAEVEQAFTARQAILLALMHRDCWHEMTETDKDWWAARAARLLEEMHDG